jgi:hypothetical protein
MAGGTLCMDRLHAQGHRTSMDVVAIVIAFATFAILIGSIELLERI